MNKEKKLRIEIMDKMFRKGVPVSFSEVAEEMNNVFKKCKSSAAYAGIYGDNFRKDLRTIRERCMPVPTFPSISPEAIMEPDYSSLTTRLAFFRIASWLFNTPYV